MTEVRLCVTVCACIRKARLLGYCYQIEIETIITIEEQQHGNLSELVSYDSRNMKEEGREKVESPHETQAITAGQSQCAAVECWRPPTTCVSAPNRFVGIVLIFV